MTRMIIADVQDVCVCVCARAIFQLSSGSRDAVAPLLTLYGVHFCITDESIWLTNLHPMRNLDPSHD